jgi:hypothetical protein
MGRSPIRCAAARAGGDQRGEGRRGGVLGELLRGSRGQPVQPGLELGGEVGRELVEEGTALSFEEVVQESRQCTVESRPHLRGCEPPGEVLGGQELLADRLPDALGQPRLVLGDRTLDPERP